MSSVNIFCDGGSRGNPGPSAGGCLVVDSYNKVIFEKGEYFGKTTNNVAEYRAVVVAFEWLQKNYKKFDISKVTFYLDSQLVVKQLLGEYKVKSIHLTPLVIQIKSYEKKIGVDINYVHVTRDKNIHADALVNQVLDSRAD